jgi:hypothetical protein
MSGPFDIRVVTLAEFTAVDEPGAEPLVGDEENNLIPEGGKVMAYGDGGAGKTTLTIDLGLHLAAGDDWLGLTIQRQARVLFVENEGPRPLFRAKLRRKLAGWKGSPLGDRVHVLEEPWARFSFAEDDDRAALADVIREREIDVVIIGPVTAAGMLAAGTIQEARAFGDLVDLVGVLSGRRVTFILIHHENKTGTVSGAWEGVGDTLLHVTGQGHGRTRLFIQKARWSSAHHATTMQLLWADGDGFELEEKPELDEEQLARQILAVVAGDPGIGWGSVEKATPGVARQTRKDVRDRLLRDGEIVNVGKGDDGHGAVLDHVPERHKACLYLPDDPTITHLRPEPGAAAAQTAPARAAGQKLALRPAPQLLEAQGVGAADTPPFDGHPEPPGWAENLIEHDADGRPYAHQAVVDELLLRDPGTHADDDWDANVIEHDELPYDGAPS